MTASGFIRRSHPFTQVIVVLAVALLALLLPGPLGPVALFTATVLLVLLGGAGHALTPALLTCFPLWTLLFLLHAVLGESPKFEVGALALSRQGLALALAQGARLGAVLTASVALLQSFNASRFIDAVAARGWSFHSAYLFVATLQAIPRLQQRAHGIIEAQRARGLSLGGPPWRRLGALRPLVAPLLLGTIAEAEDRAAALDSRAIESTAGRTPLAPPRDGGLDRTVRGLAIAGVIVAAIWRVLR